MMLDSPSKNETTRVSSLLPQSPALPRVDSKRSRSKHVVCVASRNRRGTLYSV